MIPLAVLSVLLLAALVYQQRQHAKITLDLDKRHRSERQELATRIQHPELIPAPDLKVEPWEPPEDAGAMAEIGTVAPFKDEN